MSAAQTKGHTLARRGCIGATWPTFSQPLHHCPLRSQVCRVRTTHLQPPWSGGRLHFSHGLAGGRDVGWSSFVQAQCVHSVRRWHSSLQRPWLGIRTGVRARASAHAYTCAVAVSRL